MSIFFSMLLRKKLKKKSDEHIILEIRKIIYNEKGC